LGSRHSEDYVDPTRVTVVTASDPPERTMDFVLAIVVFGVFFLGAVFAYQAFVGREINPDRTHALRGLLGDKLYVDPDQPGISHPPERHRRRLFLIGFGLMVLAVVIGIVVLD
jgi:hypothetical protein